MSKREKIQHQYFLNPESIRKETTTGLWLRFAKIENVPIHSGSFRSFERIPFFRIQNFTFAQANKMFLGVFKLEGRKVTFIMPKISPNNLSGGRILIFAFFNWFLFNFPESSLPLSLLFSEILHFCVPSLRSCHLGRHLLHQLASTKYLISDWISVLAF